MNEFFIVATSFAAPFISETTEHYIKAESPEAALEQLAATYAETVIKTGLYSATAYASHRDYHERKDPRAQWLCNHEIEKQRLTAGGGFSYLGHAPGDFEINGERHKVENPKQGRVVKT